MPTYDYECRACGHRFELFQSMTAKVRRKCPACSRPRLERLIGPGAGFLFKGDGFYVTDYRSDSYKAGKKAEDTAGSGDKPKADTPKADTPKADKPKAKDGGKGGGKSEGKSPVATRSRPKA